MRDTDFTSHLKILAERAFSSEERTNAQTMIDDISRYILPNQSTNLTIRSQVTGGQVKTKRIYDSTAPAANRDFAAILYSTMSPPTSRWSKFKHRDDKLNNQYEVAEWLDQVNEAIHQELSDSNLYKNLGMCYELYGSLGTMMLLHEEKPLLSNGAYGGVRFTSVHPSQCAWDENNDGYVDRYYQKLQMSADQIVERWPDTVPDHIAEDANNNPNKLYILYHCIYPRPKNEVKYGLAVKPENRPYGSYYFDETTGTMLEETGYYEFPLYVARFNTLPGEVVGRGLGHIVLPDVKTLNDTIADTMQAAKKALRPALLSIARNILNNNADLRDGNHITYVKNMDGIREFGTGARFDVGQVQAERLQQSIRQIYMLDKLLLPPRQETGEMSAYEIARRVEEAQRVLGPIPSRIEAELLKPLVIRQFNIMLRANALPAIPPVLRGDNLQIDIQLTSQLSRAQNIEEVQAIQQSVQFVMGLAQLDQSAVDLIDVDQAGRSGMRILGVPESVLASDEQIDSKRKQRAEIQQQQMQAELQLKQADAASKMNAGGNNG